MRGETENKRDTMNKFPDITSAFKALSIVLILTVPLAAWKLVEIAAWVIENVQISVK